MNLQEMLQKRAEKVQKQRDLLNKAKEEGRDLTEDEIKQFDDLDKEIENLDSDIEKEQAKVNREQKVAARERELNQPVNQPFRPSNIQTGKFPKDGEKDNGGFHNFGEFVNAVRFGDKSGRLEKLNAASDQSMGDDAQGGFAVPDQFREELLRMNDEAAIVRPRANVIPAGTPPDAKLTMPAFDQGAKGALGGVSVSWIAEGAEKPQTDAQLREVTLQPQEVAGHIVVTDKLLRNWTAASSFLSNLLRSAMANAEDLAFLKGDGTGKPSGVINAAGGMTVNRAAAGKVGYPEIVNMLAKLPPDSVGGAVFVANQSLLPQLMTIEDPNGNYIFIQGDATKGVPSTLAGIPIKFTGKTVAAGTKGDLMLVDFSYYLIKDGSGPFVSASEHVHFTANKTVIKAFWNVDGKPWVNEPLTLQDGSTQVSPYVILDVVASGGGGE